MHAHPEMASMADAFALVRLDVDESDHPLTIQREKCRDIFRDLFAPIFFDLVGAGACTMPSHLRSRATLSRHSRKLSRNSAAAGTIRIVSAGFAIGAILLVSMGCVIMLVTTGALYARFAQKSERRSSFHFIPVAGTNGAIPE